MHPLIVDIVDLALIIAIEGEHKMLVKAKNYNDMSWHLSYISASVHSFVILTGKNTKIYDYQFIFLVMTISQNASLNSELL